MKEFTSCTKPPSYSRILEHFMSIIPEFLMKRVYKKGSLKQTEDGVCFDLKNVLGPGFISGFSFVKINDAIFEADKVKFLTQGSEIPAEAVSEENPIGFRLGQEGTLILQGAKCLRDGINQIIIELMNPEAGKVKLFLSDNFQAA